MQRRHFLLSLLATGALPAWSSAFESRASRKLKITDVKVVTTNPDRKSLGNFVLVKIETSEPGVYGWGDCTCSGSELGVAKFLEEHLKPALLGRNPLRTENLWHTLYHLPYYRSGSVHMSAVSGIDMALWDIKGKLAGMPVYELLGGRTRRRLLTYRSVGGRDFQEVEDGVRELLAGGYRVVKVQVATPGVDGGYAVRGSKELEKAAEEAYRRGVPPRQTWEPAAYVRRIPRLFEHLRSRLEDSVELLHDVHERITPNQAIQLAKDLEPYKLFYFEDPLRPEHLDTFRVIRQQAATPIAMGEVFTGIQEGRELIREHLIDYARHDLAHVGGITAGRKIAAWCEPYGILTAWHGPGNISPVAHMANAHVSLAVPNFGIQEFSVGWGDAVGEVFSARPEYADGHIDIHDEPGLGIDVDEKAAAKYPYVRRLRPTVRRLDDTPWAY